MKIVHVAALCALAASAGVANAQFWPEVPDAPDTVPGQITVGPGFVAPLTAIIGSGDFVGDTVDSYCIYITDPLAFSATTVGSATFFDSQLWLFGPGGIGVTFNDDASSSTFLSTITGAFVPGPGFYTIAISAYDTDALNPAALEMWADGPFTVERAPDGPGVPGPLAGWTVGTGDDLTGYKIFLTGATFCVVPAPSAGALLVLGGLVGMRRRR